MQLLVESFAPPRSDQPGFLQKMFESPDLFNEGVLSFQYLLLVASDRELEDFLGKLISDAGHAVSKIATAVDRVCDHGPLIDLSDLSQTAATLASDLGDFTAAIWLNKQAVSTTATTESLKPGQNGPLGYSINLRSGCRGGRRARR